MSRFFLCSIFLGISFIYLAQSSSLISIFGIEKGFTVKNFPPSGLYQLQLGAFSEYDHADSNSSQSNHLETDVE